MLNLSSSSLSRKCFKCLPKPWEYLWSIFHPHSYSMNIILMIPGWRCWWQNKKDLMCKRYIHGHMFSQNVDTPWKFQLAFKTCKKVQSSLVKDFFTCKKYKTTNVIAFFFVRNLNLAIISFKGFFPPFELQPILSNGTLPVAAELDRKMSLNLKRSKKANAAGLCHSAYDLR